MSGLFNINTINRVDRCYCYFFQPKIPPSPFHLSKLIKSAKIANKNKIYLMFGQIKGIKGVNGPLAIEKGEREGAFV